LDNIEKSGYKKPTPIQKYAIPCVLAKRDLMGCAQTGSGKTAAFLLPIIHSLLEDGAEPNMGASPQTPQAVIVAPTRELAIQIKDEARKFATNSIIRPVVAYGGTSSGFQLQQLFKGSVFNFEKLCRRSSSLFRFWSVLNVINYDLCFLVQDATS
jgi:probable ATP-dependent RNA helicase DDX4